jgi:hypothetical protein
LIEVEKKGSSSKIDEITAYVAGVYTAGRADLDSDGAG